MPSEMMSKTRSSPRMAARWGMTISPSCAPDRELTKAMIVIWRWSSRPLSLSVLSSILSDLCSRFAAFLAFLPLGLCACLPPERLSFSGVLCWLADSAEWLCLCAPHAWETQRPASGSEEAAAAAIEVAVVVWLPLS
jgi:hypothetical protein